MKNLKKILVVGDSFHDFARIPNVMTYSALMAWAATGHPARIYLGQGLSTEEKRAIERLPFMLSGMKAAASTKLTHKHRAENIVISEPTHCPDNERYCYEASLSIDDSCAELSDHLTGEHLQGTIIAEAARQMVIAVNEKFFILPDSPKKRFVTHVTNVTYHEYLFPLATRIVYRKVKLRAGLNGNYRATAKIELIQNDRTLATVDFEFSVLDGKFLAEQERSLAEQAVSSLLK